MKTIIKFLGATALISAAAIAAPANAAISLGDVVTCNVTGGGVFGCTPNAAIVNAGPEFDIGNPGDAFLRANFSAAGLTLTSLRSGSLGLTILNFRDLTSAFSSYTLTSTSGFNGFSAGDLSLSNNGLLSIDLRGTEFNRDASIVLALSSAVPEASTWAMMLVGFGMMGAAMRYRRSSTNVVYA